MAGGFRIAARALRQLGAELITSDDVALNELIKNAFDARSPRVSVEIHSFADLAALALLEEQIRQKKVTKQEALERVDKAISPDVSMAQRSELIERLHGYIESRVDFAEHLKEFRQEQSLKISDTGVGMSADELSDRFLVIGTPGKLLAKRTANPGDSPLLGEKGIGRLSMMRLGNVATVRSAKKGSARWNEIKFRWDRFDDTSLFLDQVDVDVESAGEADLTAQGTQIEIKELSANWTQEKVQGFIQRYMRRLQNPFAKERRPYPVDVLLNGKRQPIASLPPWLENCAQFKADITFNPHGIDGTKQILRRSLRWRDATSSETRAWEMRELTQELGLPADTFVRLGPFVANCLWFNRQMLTGNTVERTRNEIAEELNQWCGGFALYRDNFRVGKTGGMEDDWLEWDSGALRAKGFALNRYQTIGSVSISSLTNPHLIDSANRERLVACPEQLLLKSLLGDVVVKDLRVHINTIREAEAKIAIAEESTTESLKKSEESLKKTIRAIDEIGKELPREQRHKITEIRETLQSQVEYVKTIKNSLNMARETRVELLELANIGLVVEIVIHELSRLTERTGELLVDLQKKDGKADVVQVVDNLRTQIIATNKRIRTVDAMSPSGRHRRENYDAVAQTKTIVAGFKNRFQRHEITCDISLDDGAADKPLNVYMVRGLIAQTLENLLTNSVYWLQQGLKEGEVERSIRIEIDSKALTISVSDNGPGVDPKYAKEIFKPYYSTRKKGKGLGLYIAAELVDYHGGRIYLDELPEDDGRLRTFTIELPKEEA
ncbi:histidine kinase [Diaphorobacter sp. HDW4B]|uniref:ATP-binding protein n=1 Tax=Diaphorobacter sp. HDW4B TaxID=2714925 RepID=UPI00140E93AB|nr:ATP-binding protein [Diaphorobacter sp. HDW4B]QIL69099.1 histidine kinase [Diaphorobacter sp. HDW4B]